MPGGKTALIKAEIVANLVKQCDADLLPEFRFIGSGFVPQILQEQQDLWWKRVGARLGIGVADKQPEQIRIGPIPNQFATGPLLENNRNALGLFPNIRRQVAKQPAGFLLRSASQVGEWRVQKFKGSKAEMNYFPSFALTAERSAWELRGFWSTPESPSSV